MPFAKQMPGLAAAAAGALRRAGTRFGVSGRSLRNFGTGMMKTGADGGAPTMMDQTAGWAAQTLGRGMIRGGRSQAGTSAMTGALAGGMWGAVSDDTSVVGGALMGAGLGVGALGAAKLGRRGLSMYNYTRGAGMGRGAAAAQGGLAMGGMAKSFIGNSYAKAVNQFSSGMKAGMR